VSAHVHRYRIETTYTGPITVDHATLNAGYAAIITRHPTDSEQPADAFDDGDQDAHTAPAPLPMEPAPPSTADLRSVGVEDLGVVDEAVDHCGDDDVAEDFTSAAEGLLEVTMRLARS
jgi:hypothetical protein